MDCGGESNGDAEGGNEQKKGHCDESEERHGLEEPELERMRAVNCAHMTGISMATMWV